MKNFLILFLLLISSFAYSQNYQADYKSIFVNVEANRDFAVFVKFDLDPSKSEVPMQNQGKIRVKSVNFLETGIFLNGVTYTDSSPDLIRSSGELVFVPYSNILNVGANGVSDFVLVIKTN